MSNHRRLTALLLALVLAPVDSGRAGGAEPAERHQEERSAVAADGTIELNLPQSAWRVSAVLVSARSPLDAARLISTINAGDDAALAADPAREMAGFKADLPGLGELPAVEPQPDYGCNLVVGNKGWPLRIVLQAVHYAGAGTGVVRYSVFEALRANVRSIRWAVPVALGDTFKGEPVVATLPSMFGVGDSGDPLPEGKAFQYRSGRTFQFTGGRAFHAKRFEAVVGSEAAERHGLKLGDRLRLQHGREREHQEQWEVVGVLKPTGTANDRAVFIPLVSFYAVPAHAEALRERELTNRPAGAAVQQGGRPRG